MRHNLEEGVNPAYVHIPVLWREIAGFIDESKFGGNGIFIDCTLGEGGHSDIFLRTYPGLRVIAFERDSAILDVARERLKGFGDRIEFIDNNFSDIMNHIKHESVNFIVYDFGISSFHFDRSGRGFALSKDEALDMRLDSSAQVDARYIVNNYPERDLSDVIFRLGDERWARKIAHVICDVRRERPIETTAALAETVLRAIPRKFHVKNIHPATRVFQALRIAVNNELEAIGESLKDSYKALVPGGRLMAISFHSLEDRIVKDRLRKLAKGCVCDAEPQHCQCRNDACIKLLTKKPIVPESDEIQKNNRARSAKLRVCERL